MNRLETWATVHFLKRPRSARGTLLHLGLAVPCHGHVLLHKRDVAAAIGWIGSPSFRRFGAALLMFGINRCAAP